ncbi:glycoprotein p61-like protein [Hibiscus yellow blotch virus]|uniref:Glycoprotein p61-like protein n=1 Tax=Hibiscus yellow blotch virus TaxID=2809748 RepID=A0A890CSW2_9VIRU|nr:glycoprotein p61-like protein [Hibiscus yellow blotch virus]QRG34868.1 glycoprotein p61-like protein [Hibiscus yellow blotch virus]
MAYYLPIITCFSLFFPDISRVQVVLEDGFSVSKDCFIECKGASCPPLPKHCFHELHTITVAKHWFFPNDILKFSTRVLSGKPSVRRGFLLTPDVSRFDRSSFVCKGTYCSVKACTFDRMLYSFDIIKKQAVSVALKNPGKLDCLGCQCSVSGVSNYLKLSSQGFYILSDHGFCSSSLETPHGPEYHTNLLFSGTWDFGVIHENSSDHDCFVKFVFAYTKVFFNEEVTSSNNFEYRTFMIPRGEELYVRRDIFVFEYNDAFYYMSQLCIDEVFSYKYTTDFNVTCHGTHCFYDGFDYDRLRRKCLVLLDSSKRVSLYALNSLLHPKAARCEIPTQLEYLVDIPVSRDGDFVTFYRVYRAEEAYIFEPLPVVDYNVRLLVATVDTSIVSGIGHYVLTVFVKAFVYVVVDVLLALAKSILTTIVEFGGCCFRVFLYSVLDLLIVLIFTLNSLTKISVFVYWIFCFIIRIWSSSCCLDLHNLLLDYVDN